MNGQPNVNPFARSYSESLRPYVDRTLEFARPELEEIACIYIHTLPWLKRKIAYAIWWPILKILTSRIVDAVIEAFLAVRGEIRANECSPSVRAALESPKSSAAVAGSPMIDASEATSMPESQSTCLPKIIRTVHQGREFYWLNGAKNPWIPAEAVKAGEAECMKFPCYEVALSYLQEISTDRRWGDPKIVTWTH